MSELASLSAGELLDHMAAGRASAVEIARTHLERIETWNPQVRAFLRLNPRALDEAAASDRRRSAGAAGALEGLPVAIKDNLHVRGVETSCASRVLDGFIPAEDATAVARLRDAGAVILGKTNMDEFAMGSSTENSAHGPTRNPWDFERVPGGSSGGSAAAVAAGFAPVALGSDTGGSIRQPAALCGIVGLKPTYGRVSRSGLVAFGSSLDQVGPMARSVADAARLLEVLAGPDPRDATSAPQPVENWSADCDRGVRGLRVGLPHEYFEDGLDPEIAAAVQQAALALEREGAVIHPVALPHTRYSIPAYYLLATAEASSNLARYDGVRFGRRAAGLDPWPAMVARSRGQGFGAEVRRRIMLGTFALSSGYHARFYERAQRARNLVREDFLQAFGAGTDLLLTPVTPTAAFRLGEKVDDPLSMYLSDIYTTTANLAGLPGLAVPAGVTSAGLPAGCQLLGPHYAEGHLFRAGAVISRSFPVELAPPFRPPGGRS
jgi:aspartyl-tRNA(Asn)/glutamyl-tRNA(Gln) amidotransferase subunit A